MAKKALPSKAAASRRRAAKAGQASAAQRKLDRMAAQLQAARARIAELEARADTDAQLDLLNRQGFERELRRAIAYLRRYRAAAAIIYLDIDRLKPVNDRFGHAAGDALLKAVAQRLVRQVRLSDVVARLGGDEFGLLLWNLGEADALAKARSLEEAVAAVTLVRGGKAVRAGASAGVTMLDKEDDPERALARADQAMYRRKRARRAGAAPRIRR